MPARRHEDPEEAEEAAGEEEAAERAEAAEVAEEAEVANPSRALTRRAPQRSSMISLTVGAPVMLPSLKRHGRTSSPTFEERVDMKAHSWR